jgi:GT2 family glycosyltransferase
VTGAPLVSVLFVSCERPDLLERTVRSFRQNTDYPNLETVITDDGSSKGALRRMGSLSVDKLLAHPRFGLGGNVNAGLRACSGEFILVLQDDWECVGPSDYLLRSVRAMQKWPELGFVRFYGVNPQEHASSEVDAELGLWQIQRPSQITEQNRHVYSDTPHLRSARSIDLLGPYSEKLPMEETEREYEERFLRQSLQVGYFPDMANHVFQHIGHGRSFHERQWMNSLASLATPIKRHAAPVHELAKRTVLATRRLLFRLRLTH